MSKSAVIQRCLDEGIDVDTDSEIIEWLKYEASDYTHRFLYTMIDEPEILEAVKARYKYEQAKYKPSESVLDEYPPLVQIELSSRCNYRCVFCYQSDDSFSSNKDYMGFMDPELFRAVIDEIEGKVPFITFASRGEPTLHPKFAELLSYCKGKFLDIKVNTNFSTVGDKEMQAIADVCNTVIASVDSADKEDYERLRVNGKFENIEKRIKKFKEEYLDQSQRRSKISFNASGVAHPSNTNSVELGGEHFTSLFDEVSMTPYDPWEIIYELPKNSSKKTCSQPWMRFFIWFDGTYSACDMDFKNLLHGEGVNNKIGKNHSVSSAWRSESMENLRNKHISEKRSDLFPCDRCPL